MLVEVFEKLLEDTVNILNEELGKGVRFNDSKQFENRVRDVLVELLDGKVEIDYHPHPYIFPDIAVGEYGIEVKFTTSDNWRSVANSVFESIREQDVSEIYIIYGKMGGAPEVKWGRYEDCVMHVRTSHVPRFEVQMFPDESLFDKFGISYKEFRQASPEDKMFYIRKYARDRLKPGEHLWWLEETAEPEHSLPLQVRLFMNLSTEEKRQLRAEAALLCPQIVKPSRTRNKYHDAALYLLTYHGVMCPQARDLFSAGSVALRADDTRGGNYVLRALQDIEQEMRNAAMQLEEALFVEYWGESVPPDQRIKRWLELADSYARDWRPSKELFLEQADLQ